MKSDIYKKMEMILYDVPFIKKRISMIELRLAKVSETAPSKNFYVQQGGSYYNALLKESADESDYITLLKKEAEERKAFINEVIQSLSCLSPLEKSVIKLHYFENRSMQEIAGQMKYSREYLSRVRKRAVEKLAKIFLGVFNY